MEKLIEYIEPHSKWEHLKSTIAGIEEHREGDFSKSVEYSKSLLESIGKQICKERGIYIDNNMAFPKLMDEAFAAVGYAKKGVQPTIAKNINTINLEIGKLRNKTGPISHGKLKDEFDRRNDKFDECTRFLLLSTVEAVAYFLIMSAEINTPFDIADEDELLSFADQGEFNDYLDDEWGSITIGDAGFSASEILYDIDSNLYKQLNYEWNEEKKKEGGGKKEKKKKKGKRKANE